MAKLVSVVLVSALLVIMITATSAYRTIITTVEVDETNPDCRREIQGQNLRACERYLRPWRSPAEEKLQEEEMEECCSQLKNMKDECQCEAIMSVFQPAKSEAESEETPEVLKRGSMLPSSCGVRDCRVSFARHF